MGGGGHFVIKGPLGVGQLSLLNLIIFQTQIAFHRPGGYSHTLPIRVYAAQRGRDFEAPDLERGIQFGVPGGTYPPKKYPSAPQVHRSPCYG